MIQELDRKHAKATIMPVIQEEKLRDLLDEMRDRGDPEVDRLMSDIMASQTDVGLSDMMRHQWTTEMFERSADLPAWADAEKIERGQALFYRYGMTIVTLLFFSALPEGYACKNPAQVLTHTGNMVDGRSILQRILRTAQFLIDVMMPGSLRPNGKGVQSAVRLRFQHSAVRTRLRNESWAGDRMLINQEELGGTLGTFSVLMLDGMRKFDIDFTPQEIDAFVHVWNVVGYLMGIDERLLHQDPDAAKQQFYAIKTRIQAPCSEGRDLTRALLDFLHEMIPGDVLDHFADTLMRDTVGKALADDLEIPDPDWTKVFLPLVKHLGFICDEAGDRSVVVCDVLQQLQTKLIEALMGHYSNEAARVSVPADLSAQWGIGPRTA